MLTNSAAMNYVSAVYGILAIIIALDWFLRARKHYRGQTARHQDAAARMGEIDGEGTVKR